METEVIPGVKNGGAGPNRGLRGADGGDSRNRRAPDSVAVGNEGSSRWEMEFVDPLEGDQWDRLGSGHPEWSVFHTSAWARVLNATYGHSPFYLRIAQDGKTAALVPMMEVCSRLTGRRGVCVPFSDFAEPLIFNGDAAQEVFRLLANLVVERNWKHLEIRGSRTVCPGSVVPGSNFYGHRLDLGAGFDALQAGFSSSVRRAIGKAQRCELSVEVSHSSEAINDYFDLHTLTRKRHGLPPQPRSFFEEIHREFIESEAGFIVLVNSARRPVAGALFLQSGDSAVYKFGASDDESWEFRPNNLVMYEGIRCLIGKGAKTLHFGRTAVEQEGLRRFKLSWGGEEERIDYIKYDRGLERWTPATNRSAGLAKACFRRMPQGMNRLAGSFIYPHLD